MKLEYGVVYGDQPREISDDNDHFYAYMHKFVVRAAERAGGTLIEGPARLYEEFPPRDCIRLAWPIVREVPDVL